jgi:hypothetical protein
VIALIEAQMRQVDSSDTFMSVRFFAILGSLLLRHGRLLGYHDTKRGKS